MVPPFGFCFHDLPITVRIPYLGSSSSWTSRHQTYRAKDGPWWTHRPGAVRFSYLVRMWMSRLNNFFCFRFGLWHFFSSKSFGLNTEWIPFFNQYHSLLQFVTLNYSLSPKPICHRNHSKSSQLFRISWLSVRQEFYQKSFSRISKKVRPIIFHCLTPYASKIGHLPVSSLEAIISFSRIHLSSSSKNRRNSVKTTNSSNFSRRS